MNNEELLNRYNDITEFFKKLYFIYQKEGEKIPRTYNAIWWPSHYLSVSCGIEVEVTLSTAKSDYKHEEDEYTHALGKAAMEVLFNPECELSEIFNKCYLDILFEKKMFFEDRKKYTFPYEVFEKGKGGLRNFISSTYVEDSWFSYQFFISHLYAYKDKPNMYLSYKGKVLITEEEFKDLINRIDKEVNTLKEIYHRYYEEVLNSIYKQTDLLIDDYEEVRRYIRDNKPLTSRHYEILKKISNVYDDLSNQYDQAIDKKNIETYIKNNIALQ